MWPRSCSRAAATSAAGAPSDSARAAVCSACSSCVTPSPSYSRPPLRAKSVQMSESERDMIVGWRRRSRRLRLALFPTRRVIGHERVRLLGWLGRLEARAREHAGLLEYRVGDRADVGIDAPHV